MQRTGGGYFRRRLYFLDENRRVFPPTSRRPLQANITIAI
jgi:hypothetical protein